MNKLILIFTLLFLITSINHNGIGSYNGNTKSDFQGSNLSSGSQNDNSQIMSSTIVMDGVVSAGEYAVNIQFDPTFQFYYSTDSTTIYIGLVANTAGWVSIGFGSPVMSGSDVIIGYYAGSTTIVDAYAPGYSLTTDTTDNVLNFGGGETGGVTTLEFSRLLDTGDIIQDNVITIGISNAIIWGYGSADDIVSYHSARGSTNVVFIGPPTAPQNLIATPLNGQVDLTWQTPSGDGGSTISGYNIYRSDVSGTGYSFIETTGALTYSDVTVVNGQTYYFVVRALNIMGEGLNSNEANAIPSQSIPNPQNLVANAEINQVTLSWDPPISDGGSPITHYNIYRSVITGSGYIFLNQNMSVLGYVDTDIENTNTYYYVVTAVNGFAESAYSNEDNATPTGSPLPPINLVAVAGSNNVTLNWTIPINDGGFTITEYTIFRSWDVAGGPYDKIGVNDTDLGYFDGLAIDGETYYYVVVANNSAGGSGFSNEQKATLLNVPFSANNLTASSNFNFTSSLSSVFLSWNASDSNGNPMVHYNIYRSEIEGVTGSLIGNSTDGLSLNYTDFTTSSGVKYFYLIAGVNTQGEGVYSPQISVTTGTVSGVPHTLVTVAGNSQTTIKWKKPFENGGLSITQYHVFNASTTDGAYVYLASVPQKSYTVIGLTNGVPIYFKVMAENSKGNSSFSDSIQSIPGTVPTEVTNFEVTSVNANVILNWSKPLSDGGYNIVEYHIFRSVISGTSYTYVGSNTSSNGFEIVNGVLGVKYYFVVRSVNIMGESGFSIEKSISIADVPSSPFGLNGVAGVSQALLNWNGSQDTGGTPIIRYNVYRAEVKGGQYSLVGTTVGNYSFVDNTVTNNVTYFYVVTSENVVGESDYSNEVEIFPYIVVTQIVTSNSISSTKSVVATNAVSGGNGSGPKFSGEQFFATLSLFASFAMLGVVLIFLRRIKLVSN